MILKEFFNKPLNVKTPYESGEDKGMADDLFWFIIDHDRLHKDYFFPIAKKLKKLKDCDDDTIYEMFMPMVIKGSKEYYNHNEMNGKLSKKFPVEMRKELCHRLYNQYKEDIDKKVYKLG